MQKCPEMVCGNARFTWWKSKFCLSCVHGMQLHCLNTRSPVACATHRAHICREALWSDFRILLWKACKMCTCEVRQPDSSRLLCPTHIIYCTLYGYMTMSQLEKCSGAFKRHQRKWDAGTLADFGALILLESSLCFSQSFLKSQRLCLFKQNLREN